MQDWQGFLRFQMLSKEQRRVVFYSEGKQYWVHLEPMVKQLSGAENIQVCYVSSGKDDPGLHQNNKNILPFYIGENTARTFFFHALDAKVLLMTMPDLQTFHIKRSIYPVNYVYVFHSLASSHMIYFYGSMDHFDTIFCSGPHHYNEIKEGEVVYKLKPKKLLHHGYGRLDALLAEKPKQFALNQKRVLIAPSWGDHGLLENVGDPLIAALLDGGFEVTVRPHPLTRKHHPEVLDALYKKYTDNAKFHTEEDVTTRNSLYQADVMISDWSGVALEYAFVLERPVLFIDLPKKVKNPKYTELQSAPLEVAIRDKIGEILSVEEIAAAPQRITSMISKSTEWAEKIRVQREAWVYNVGCSAEVGAGYVKEILGIQSLPESCNTPEGLLSYLSEQYLENLPAGRTAMFLQGAVKQVDNPASISADLEALCRKADIAKKIYTNYDETWKKPVDKSPLSTGGLFLLAALFAVAASKAEKADTEQRGQALKYINAAHNTLALVAIETEQEEGVFRAILKTMEAVTEELTDDTRLAAYSSCS